MRAIYTRIYIELTALLTGPDHDNHTPNWRAKTATLSARIQGDGLKSGHFACVKTSPFGIPSDIRHQPETRPPVALSRARFVQRCSTLL